MILDILIVIFVIFLGFHSSSIFPILRPKDKVYLKYLWIYHLLFGIIFWAYIVYGPGGDADGYWSIPKELSFTEALEGFQKAGPGTYAMYVLNFFFSNSLDLNFFSFSMIYCFVGYLGFVLFYVIFFTNIQYNSHLKKIKLFPAILFLPNLHFWSAGSGKDTLLFFCIALFIYGIQKPSKNVIKILFAVVLSYLVRPHITIFLISSFGLAFIIDGNLKFYQKLILGVIFIGAFVLVFDDVMSFLKLEDLNSETIGEFSEERVQNLSRAATSSSVDISSYPLILKVLTFLYRPLFFDINGLLAIIASLENFFLLILSIKFLRQNPIELFRKSSYLFKGMFFFFMIGSISFSLILGNLGIMLRQKNMFIPCLLFIILSGFSYQVEKQRRKLPKVKKSV